jgi:hypothetical protein
MNQADPISASVTGDSSGKGVKWTVSCPVGVNSCGGMAQPSTTSGTQNMFSASSNVTSPETVTVTAISVADSSKFATVAVTVNPAPSLSNPPPAQPEPGTVGQPFSFSLAPFVQGGSAPFNWTIKSGTLPAGLLLSASSGMISGTPTVATESSSQRQAQLRASAASGTATNLVFTGADSGKPNLSVDVPISITINSQSSLPLAFVTTSPLQAGGVGIFYNSLISVTGGVGPYAFTLVGGSSPLPVGLSLNAASGSISGIPNTTGNTENIIIGVADSQSPPTTATMTYSLTVNPSIFYVGTQAPGDVWQLGISHASTTDGAMGLQDQGSNGLTGPLSGPDSLHFSTFPNGFISGGIWFFPRTAVEMPGDVVLLVPSVGGRIVGSETDRVVVAAANTCPQLPATTNYQFVALADEDFDLTKDAYGVASVTHPAANSYNFAFNSFTLEGATGTSNTLPGLSCDGNLKVFSSTSATGIISTVAISASGFMVVDNGTGIPAVGVQQPLANLSTTAILGAQYLGAVFFANDNVTTFCPGPPIPCTTKPAAATDLVGFGPGSATSISGGTYQKINSDLFNTHATNYVVTLGTQTSPGLFTGGTLAVSGKSLGNFDAVVGQVKGKFVLFGVTLDDTVTPIQPYVVLLVQQ